MRIAMVSEHANPLAVVGGVDAGGQNVHVAALSTALAALGHEVTVYTRRDDPAPATQVAMGPGVTVEHVDAGPAREVPKDELLPYMPAFGRYLADVWAAEPPDVVHAHFWMSGLAALIGARGLNVPVVQTFHALGSVKRRFQGAADTSPPGRIRLESAIARQVDRVVATCEDEVRELCALGATRSRIDVVPCGVDLDLFTDDGPSLPRGDLRRLVCLGRLVERKGIDTAVEAMATLRGAELLIAGGPPVERLDEDPEAVRLQEVIRRVGVSDRVHLLGRVLREDVPALLRSADALVTVPWYEPFGITPLEAMACGTPVVAAEVGGLLDTVVPGVTGVLVPPRRPDLLTQALAALLADPVGLASMGMCAVERARGRFGWDRIAAETARAYEAVRAARGAAMVAS